MKTKIVAKQTNIVKLKVDAIVNAAAPEMLGGGGVDGAIHEAAGPELFAECSKLGELVTGQAKITKGYNLPAKHVIHALGPIYESSEPNNDELLKDCYKNSLALADEYKLKTIAFCLISSGVFGYPKDLAAKLAFEGIHQYLGEHPDTQVQKIMMVAYTEDEYKVIKKEFSKAV